jgi:hypothetical protein
LFCHFEIIHKTDIPQPRPHIGITTVYSKVVFSNLTASAVGPLSRYWLFFERKFLHLWWFDGIGQPDYNFIQQFVVNTSISLELALLKPVDFQVLIQSGAAASAVYLMTILKNNFFKSSEIEAAFNENDRSTHKL